MAEDKKPTSPSSSSSSRVPVTMRDLFYQDPFFESSWADFDKVQQDMNK